MGKKRNRKKLTSKGLRSKVKNATITATNSARGVIGFASNKIDAWAKGLNPWLTVENPNKGATNARLIRVKANDYLGPWKFAQKEEKQNG